MPATALSKSTPTDGVGSGVFARLLEARLELASGRLDAADDELACDFPLSESPPQALSKTGSKTAISKWIFMMLSQL